MITRVASLHFAPVEARRAIYGGHYEMPPVALGAEPAVLSIDDKIQRDEGPISTGPGGGRRQQLRYQVFSWEIADDIVSQWAKNGLGMTPECHPGIWVVRETLPVMVYDEKTKTEIRASDGFGNPVTRPATPEESRQMWHEDLAHARAADRAYAEWCYLDGNRIASDVRTIQFIPKNYKLAARHYGLEADWLKEGAALEVKPCIYCTKVISKRSIVCPFCQQVNDNDRFAAMQVARDTAIRDAKKAAA